VNPFATLEDIETRYPAELITLAADEETGIRDDARINAAIDDATAEVRTILAERYSDAELEQASAQSLATLRIYTIDIALYRVALSFSRSNDEINDRYKMAIARLEAIARGKAALVIEGSSAGSEVGDGSDADTVLVAPPRMFGRDSSGGL